MTYEDVEAAQTQLEDAKSKYLRERGWIYTCQTPGAYWVWRKQLGEIDSILASTDLAISMERNWR